MFRVKKHVVQNKETFLQLTVKLAPLGDNVKVSQYNNLKITNNYALYFISCLIIASSLLGTIEQV
jgi:hypothetical protein